MSDSTRSSALPTLPVGMEEAAGFVSVVGREMGGKVELQETIAEGAPGCRVVVYLQPTPEATQAEGREYYGGAEVE